MQKIVTEGASITTTDYLGGYQYQNTVLQFFPTAEGYVKNTLVSSTNTYSYVFNYTDHLGNVRLSYTKNPSTNTLTILEENSYYPFGMKHTISNAVVQGQDYKYKYNGKELQDELSLNLYDYGARNYDTVLGRWMNVDPLAETSRRFSPYVYALNNPVLFIDPDGMQALAGDANNPNQMVPFERERMGIHFIGGDGPGDPPKNYVPSPGFPGSNSPMELDEVVINTKDPYEGTYFDRNNKGSGEYGPSSMSPDAMSISFNLNVNGMFFSANATAGLALTGSDAAVVFGGGISMGPQTDLSLPGIKTGWNVSIHNGLGNNNDVLKGLGGNDAGNFGGFGLGGSYSKSLIGNSNRFDPNGVQTLSLNIGPTFGLGQTKSTTWSGKFSDLLK